MDEDKRILNELDQNHRKPGGVRLVAGKDGQPFQIFIDGVNITEHVSHVKVIWHRNRPDDFGVSIGYHGPIEIDDEVAAAIGAYDVMASWNR